MAHQVIFPKNEGTKQGSLPAIVQGSTLETITILALYKDGSNVDLSTMTVTATMTDRDNSTTDVTGTLTGANGSFTWAYSAGDIGTAGRFYTIITYTDGVDSWSSEPVNFDIIANPAATAVQNPALVGVSTAKDAWLTAGLAAVPDGADLVDAGDLGTMSAVDDAPSDGTQYARQSAAWVEVVASGSGLEYVNTATDYTTLSADNAKEVLVSDVATITLADGMDAGFQQVISRVGSGVVTVAPTTTLYKLTDGTGYDALAFARVGTTVVVRHLGSNIWLITGDFTGSAPVSEWWIEGGATGAMAVYQPLGAIDLAASYLDLSGNGNNAAPGTAPSFSAVDGWSFTTASSQYLTTGIPPLATYSAIILYSDVVGAGYIFGSVQTATTRFSIAPNFGAANVTYGLGANLAVTPPHLSGTLAISGNKGYRDGTADAGTMDAWSGTNANNILIGCRNAAGSPSDFITAKIQAFALYDNALDAAEILAVSNALAAL